MLVIFFFMDQLDKNRALSDILNLEKLANVDREIELANGLPNECYTSEQYLSFERNTVFSDKWTAIGVLEVRYQIRAMQNHTTY